MSSCGLIPRVNGPLRKISFCAQKFTGTLVVAPTVHLAFDECYYLERACMSQMMALNAAGGDVTKLAMVDEEIVKMSSKTYTTAEYLQLYSVKHFYAWWNKYLKEEADVFE